MFVRTHCLVPAVSPSNNISLVTCLGYIVIEGAKTVVRTSSRKTLELPVEVGLHQGPVLSQLLFNIVMDVVS